MKIIISKLRKDLKANSDAKTRLVFKRFFKEEVAFYGVKSAVVAKISKEHFNEVKDLGKNEILLLCEEMWKNGYGEEAWIAAEWAARVSKDYLPGDFKVLKRWIEKYVDNWAKCDTLCNHAVGDFIVKYPSYIKELKRWAKSKNKWVKRAAAVSLIVPAKEGMFLKDVFEIADILLLDPDDLVQKGYGWMLKVAANKHEKEVFNYVFKHKAEMPRTALRYAIEKMPKNLKQKAMS